MNWTKIREVVSLSLILIPVVTAAILAVIGIVYMTFTMLFYGDWKLGLILLGMISVAIGLALHKDTWNDHDSY